MIDARFQQVCAIIQQVIDHSPQKREAFIREACGDDLDLASEVLAAFDPDPAIAAMLEFPDVRPVEDPLIGQKVKDFQIESLIGSGGMGIVYKAVQVSTGKSVALKFIHLHQISSPFGTAGRIRFKNEIETLAKLDHPNIAKILTAEIIETSDGSRPFFAMEFVDGRALDKFIIESRAPIYSIVKLVAEIAEALAHAHSRGCIHRDIKPQNILVDNQGHSKIIDFGIAKAVDPLGITRSHPTFTNQSSFPIGTLTYMSPEQGNRPQDVDIRTDVYSLGAIAYELLARRRPLDFTNLSFAEALRMLAEKEPPPLRSHIPKLDVDIDTVIAKAMAKDPAIRYPDAAHFAADLRRFLNHEPILARTPTVSYRVRKFTRRNRGLTAGIGIAATSLVLGTTLATMGMLRAVEQRQLAEASAETNAKLRWATFDAVGQLAELAVDSMIPLSEDPGTVLQRTEATRKRTEALLEKARSPDLHIEAKAAVLHVIGDQYTALGDALRAEQVYREVIELHTQEAESLDITAARASLAFLLLQSDRLDESAALLETAIPILRSQKDERWQLESAGALDNLARVRHSQGRLVESDRLYQAELSIRRRLQGDASVHTAVAEHNWTLLIIDLDKSAEAEPILLRILAFFEAETSPESREVALVLRTLGIALREQNKPADAEAALLRAVSIANKTVGENSQLGAVLRLHLGASILDQCELLTVSEPPGKIDTVISLRLNDAENLLRSAFTTLNSMNGLSSSLKAESRAELARALSRARKLDEAGKLLIEARTFTAEIPGVVRIERRVRISASEFEQIQSVLAR